MHSERYDNLFLDDISYGIVKIFMVVHKVFFMILYTYIANWGVGFVRDFTMESTLIIRIYLVSSWLLTFRSQVLM